MELRHTIRIERKSATRDASGGAVEGWAAVPGASSLPCLVQVFTTNAHRGAPRMLGQRQVLISHVAYFTEEPPVQRGDRIRWLEEDVLLIHQGLEDMGGQGRWWRLQLSLETA